MILDAMRSWLARAPTAVMAARGWYERAVRRREQYPAGIVRDFQWSSHSSGRDTAGGSRIVRRGVPCCRAISASWLPTSVRSCSGLSKIR